MMRADYFGDLFPSATVSEPATQRGGFEVSPVLPGTSPVSRDIENRSAMRSSPVSPVVPGRNERNGERFAIPLANDLAAALGEGCKGLNLEPADLQALLTDEDVTELSADQEAHRVLRAFASAIVGRRTREAGRVPSGYSEHAHCRWCGPIWAPFRGSFLGCPWCHVRAKGIPIPRPEGEDE